MSSERTYPNWKALNAALSSAAKAQSLSTGQSQGDLMKMAYLDRFLCRVFDNGEGADWVLKGGTGMLSRVPGTRTTKDIDVATSVGDIDEAERSLTDLVARDIGDHLTFDLEASAASIDSTLHPGVTGRRLFYRMRDEQTRKPLIRIPVDMTVEPAPIGGVDVFDPRNRILPKHGLPIAPYRLYPVPDQIADKVTATMQSYGPDRHSTRVKDLVDLVVIARTQRVNLDKLKAALAAQHHRTDDYASFTPPAQWKNDYAHVAKQVPAVGPFHDFDGATALVRKLVDPALATEGPSGLTWNSDTGWEPAAASSTQFAPENDPNAFPPPTRAPGPESPEVD